MEFATDTTKIVLSLCGFRQVIAIRKPVVGIQHIVAEVFERRAVKRIASGARNNGAAASLGVFDVAGIGSTDVVLVQVKSSEWPRAEEMEALKLFRCPANCRKLIHRWRNRVQTPDVREVPL